MRVAVVGAGWAGLTAAVRATQAGHQVSLLEASHTLGGRARAQTLQLAHGSSALLDNGQHILIGAYRETLQLMHSVGVDPQRALLRMPLALQFPDGQGLCLPDWPAPLDALVGMARVRGWSLADKWSLLRATLAWQIGGFRCAPDASVLDLCRTMRPTVLQTLIEPLCVSALNTPAAQASGQVFLRVLHDSLLGGHGASNLLLPRTDLGQLFPDAAAQWLRQHGAQVLTGVHVHGLAEDAGWRLDCSGATPLPERRFDAVVWATSAAVAARLLSASAPRVSAPVAAALQAWSRVSAGLRYESIATVYLHAEGAHLPLPMLALRSDAAQPAQFVFDRGQLGGPPGLLAFVVSASQDSRAELQEKVLQQARKQLAQHLPHSPQLLQTVVEKRATFACTPGLQRPVQAIAPGLWACGDYVDGPYPATLEGAVRSGLAVARALGQAESAKLPLDSPGRLPASSARCLPPHPENLLP